MQATDIFLKCSSEYVHIYLFNQFKMSVKIVIVLENFQLQSAHMSDKN